MASRAIGTPASTSRRLAWGVIQELVQNRRLVLWMFRREVAARYQQSVLRFAWVFIPPLVGIGVMLVLEMSGVVASGAGLPYPVFVALGITIWGLFSRTITESMSSLVAAGSLVTRVACPRSTLVMSKALVALVEVGIRLPVVWLAMPFFGISPSPWQLLGVIALVPLFLLAIAIGMTLAVLVAVMRDIQWGTPLVLTGMLLLTPVFYAAPPDSLLARLNAYNPLHVLISTPRWLLAGDPTVEPGYGVATCFTLVLLALSLRFFAVAQPRIAERVG